MTFVHRETLSHPSSLIEMKCDTFYVYCNRHAIINMNNKTIDVPRLRSIGHTTLQVNLFYIQITVTVRANLKVIREGARTLCKQESSIGKAFDQRQGTKGTSHSRDIPKNYYTGKCLGRPYLFRCQRWPVYADSNSKSTFYLLRFTLIT